MIYLLNISHSNQIKTTLDKWSRRRNDIGGFLSVKILEHLTLKKISSRTYFQFQVDDSFPGETTEINDFILNKEAFEVALKWLQNDIDNPRLKYYFIDEVGSLEIDDLGHDKLVKQVIQQDSPENVFILFVREPFIQSVQEKYNLAQNKIISLKQITG